MLENLCTYLAQDFESHSLIPERTDPTLPELYPFTFYLVPVRSFSVPGCTEYLSPDMKLNP